MAASDRKCDSTCTLIMCAIKSSSITIDSCLVVFEAYAVVDIKVVSSYLAYSQ